MSALGVEIGSTRIKAVILGERREVVCSGSHGWENQLENGYWTYDLDDVQAGVRDAVSQLSLNELPAVIGVSAMMHGYLAFNESGRLLAPFRTWRNTTTEQAATILTREFGFNIPQRWSIAHLYQAILNGEAHVKDIAFITTLAGYVHWRLTGKKLIGIGDASGMFPVENGQYSLARVEKFRALTGMDWLDVAPKILLAGQRAGNLTAQGAAFLGLPGGTGIPLCPPEGDAGTGMVATHSIAERTGNVSAGTSIFAMAVLDRPLRNPHPEIDRVSTPDGKPVAMVHCNNCTSDIDAWVRLFAELSDRPRAQLYDLFYDKALDGEPDGGGLLSYNYFSGEPVTGLDAGRPLLVRMPDARLTLANFCRCLLYSAVATLRIGMDILSAEGVTLEKLCGHGGLFKSAAGQKIMADALDVPVSVRSSAGEGGAWGIALLADYALNGDRPLAEYLSLLSTGGEKIERPEKRGVDGFAAYLRRYEAGIAIQKISSEVLKNE
jgi:sugar (pentulose or hexulose) kinase